MLLLVGFQKKLMQQQLIYILFKKHMIFYEIEKSGSMSKTKNPVPCNNFLQISFRDQITIKLKVKFSHAIIKYQFDCKLL